MDSQSFDYVIVGAGSSGCALAHRLVTATTASVLLIEAGPGAIPPVVRAASSGARVRVATGADHRWM